jgi:hypothetical protein
MWRECGDGLQGDLIGLNATLGRGLNIMHYRETSAGSAIGVSRVPNSCAHLGMLSLLLDGCANK